MEVTEEVFKFGFQRILSGYSRQARGQVKQRICEAWKVSHQRYYQILNAKNDSPVNISGDQALSAARILNVPVSEILMPSEMISC
jgi:hypothetical protein